MEGRLICGFCSLVGHTDLRCFQNPASPNYRGQDIPPQQMNILEQPFINNQR
jgi:hypothetical protein